MTTKFEAYQTPQQSDARVDRQESAEQRREMTQTTRGRNDELVNSSIPGPLPHGLTCKMRPAFRLGPVDLGTGEGDLLYVQARPNAEEELNRWISAVKSGNSLVGWIFGSSGIGKSVFVTEQCRKLRGDTIGIVLSSQGKTRLVTLLDELEDQLAGPDSMKVTLRDGLILAAKTLLRAGLVRAGITEISQASIEDMSLSEIFFGIRDKDLFVESISSCVEAIARATAQTGASQETRRTLVIFFDQAERIPRMSTGFQGVSSMQVLGQMLMQLMRSAYRSYVLPVLVVRLEDKIEFETRLFELSGLLGMPTGIIHMRPLESAGTRELVESTARAAGLTIDQRVVEDMVEKSKGYPFLAQAIGQLVQRELRTGNEIKWSRYAGLRYDTMHEIFGQRLGSLGLAERSILDTLVARGPMSSRDLLPALQDCDISLGQEELAQILSGIQDIVYRIRGRTNFDASYDVPDYLRAYLQDEQRERHLKLRTLEESLRLLSQRGYFDGFVFLASITTTFGNELLDTSRSEATGRMPWLPEPFQAFRIPSRYTSEVRRIIEGVLLDIYPMCGTVKDMGVHQVSTSFQSKPTYGLFTVPDILLRSRAGIPLEELHKLLTEASKDQFLVDVLTETILPTMVLKSQGYSLAMPLFSTDWWESVLLFDDAHELSMMTVFTHSGAEAENTLRFHVSENGVTLVFHLRANEDLSKVHEISRVQHVLNKPVGRVWIESLGMSEEKGAGLLNDMKADLAAAGFTGQVELLTVCVLRNKLELAGFGEFAKYLG